MCVCNEKKNEEDTVALPKLSREFKFNDGEWGAIGMGSNGEKLKLNEPYHYVNGTHDNIVIDMQGSELQDVVVGLNTNDSTVTVSLTTGIEPFSCMPQRVRATSSPRCTQSPRGRSWAAS